MTEIERLKARADVLARALDKLADRVNSEVPYSDKWPEYENAVVALESRLA